MPYRRFAKLTLPLLLMLALVLPTAAQSPTPEPEQEGQNPLLGLIATALNITPAQAEIYKAEAGFGGLVKASRLAQASGQSLDALLARHAAGEGWGEIAKSLGLHPGNKGNNLGQLIKQQRAKEQGKPGQGGRPDVPPGQAKKNPDQTPPGQDQTPPGLDKTPPGHGGTPPGQSKNKQKPPKGDDDADDPDEDGEN
jgi:hypothetical protein